MPEGGAARGRRRAGSGGVPGARFSTLVVQPGLSIGVCTGEQPRLIAAAASYVESVTKGAFEVYCSA